MPSAVYIPFLFGTRHYFKSKQILLRESERRERGQGRSRRWGIHLVEVFFSEHLPITCMKD
ncbi:hypothetical protein INR49_000045 [Caranx melampygus]|nr:hypothetical protein INR49_000045 [Caranx melampygus]